MKLSFREIKNHELRAKAAARIVAIGLRRNLPHVALDAAQTAARATLLAWGMSRHGFFSHPDVAILVEVAAARRSEFHGRPHARLMLSRDLLLAMHRIMPALHERSLLTARKRVARMPMPPDVGIALRGGIPGLRRSGHRLGPEPL